MKTSQKIAILFLQIFLAWQAKAQDLTMLDMGQGEGILITCPGRSKFILVDFGSIMDSEEATPSSIGTLQKRLENSSGTIAPIDLLLVTHANQDHFNQIGKLLDAGLVVKRIALGGDLADYDKLPFKLLTNLAKRGYTEATTVGSIKDGTYYSFNRLYPGITSDPNLISPTSFAGLSCPSSSTKGVQFNVLSANVDAKVKDTGVTTNTASVVLLLQYFIPGGSPKPYASAFLTADATAKTENAMLQKFKGNFYPNGLPDLRVLKIAHHGSHFSTTPDFVKAVSPNISLASASGRWDHPACATFNTVLSEVQKSAWTKTLPSHDYLCFMEAADSSFDKGEPRAGKVNEPMFSTTLYNGKTYIGTDIDLYLDSSQFNYSLSYLIKK